MNFGTKLRTVLIIATSLNTALMATDLSGFDNATVDLIYKVVSIVLNFVIVACATYFNNDYNEISAKHTGNMRQEKAELKQDYVGERFYDEPELHEIEGGDIDE